MAKLGDPRVAKLAIKLGDGALAEALVKAGFDNPAKIRRASNKELESVPGVGKAKRGAIRKKLPQRK